MLSGSAPCGRCGNRRLAPKQVRLLCFHQSVWHPELQKCGQSGKPIVKVKPHTMKKEKRREKDRPREGYCRCQ